MLKVTPIVFAIFLLTLVQLTICTELDINLSNRLKELSKKLGFCSYYFQYLRTEDFIIGKLTLPDIKIGDTIKLQFFQIDYGYKQHFNGSLLPDESSQEIVSRLENKEPISYRVDFPLKANVPELENIFINGEEFCATIFGEYNVEEKVVLEHTLEVVNDSLPVFKYNINIPHFLKDATCGLDDIEITNKKLIPFIYGGTEIRRGEFPWLAAIYKKTTDGVEFICGGSLVTSQLILTAAHCFKDLTAADIVVELGRHNLSNSKEESVEVRQIETVILQPDYKEAQTSDADLALIRMQQPIEFTKFIKPICIWNEPADEALIVGHSGVVTGWGSIEDGTTISNVPKKVKTNVVSEIECLRSLPTFAEITSSRTLCAGKHDGSGPCEGDSGGGLMIYRNGIYFLRGVISAGIINKQRCNSQEYTVYCDVAKHAEWLDSYIGQQEEPLTGDVEEVCGTAGTKDDPRSEYPWLVSIFRKIYVGNFFHCSGALISSRTVVTAADCFYLLGDVQVLADNLRVFLGRYDLDNIQENGVVTRDVADVLRHPKYRDHTALFYDYDIALVQLKTPVGFTKYIKPICLWNALAYQSELVGQSATLLSYNMLGIYDGTITAPQSMEVKMTSIDNCLLAGYQLGSSPGFLCTPRFGNNADGLLMLKSNERWLLRGLYSADLFHVEKYNSSRYRLYTDIGEYVSWIQSNMLS